MKTIFLAATAALTLTLASCQGDKFSITATFTQPVPEGVDVWVIDYDSGDTIAASQITDGSFRVDGTAPESPAVAKIRINGVGVLLAVIEPGNLTVNTQTGLVEGTPLNDTFNELIIEESLIETDAEAIELYKSYFNANRGNAVGYYALCNYLVYDDLTYDQTAELVEGTAQPYAAGKRLSQYLEYAKLYDATREGSQYVDFSIPQPDGSTAKLSDYTGRDGQYLLVDFWASWCPPCRREIKTTLKEIYAQHNGKGLAMVGVAVRDSVPDTQRAVAELEIPWQIIYNAKRVPYDIYGFTGIPHVMIIAPDGTIVSRGLYGDALKAKVEELLQK